MLPALKEKNHQETARQMQAQLASLLAIQSMQDYLKYLILTTSLNDKKNCVSQSQDSLKDQIQADSAHMMIEENPEIKEMSSKSETNSSVHEKEIQNHSNVKCNDDMSMNYKKSHRLWNLLVKRYSSKKIKTSDTVERIEATEEGETYRNFNGVYIPVLKNQVTRARRGNICPHSNRTHYARGLCASCYHRTGREKKPWNCAHERLYALGLCHKCYLVHNRVTKKEKQHQLNDIPDSNSNGFVVKQEIHPDIQIKQEF